MTELQKRMIEDMQLAGLSQGTQDAYVRVVRQLAGHFAPSASHARVAASSGSGSGQRPRCSPRSPSSP